MFLDPQLIERTDNVTRRVHSACKHEEPVITGDLPWEEGECYLFGTAMYDADDGLFKMWYTCDGHVAYATSEDGLVWDKPRLDVAHRGGQSTHLVIEREDPKACAPMGHFYELFSVVKDPRDPDPARRYKLGFLSLDKHYAGEFEARHHRGQRRAMGTAVSPDGIHWTMENEWASHDIIDGMSCVLWDDLLGRFVTYGRTKLTPDNNDGRWRIHGWGRAVNRIESSDFRSWSPGELVMATDDRDPDGSEIYSMSVFHHEGLYVGLVQVFYGRPDQGNLDVQLAVSRDGRHFTRVEPRQPFICEGGAGSWDRFNISVGTPPVEVGDELWFYYSGRAARHSPYQGSDTGPRAGRIGLAKIERGRFVSLDASFDGGVVLTRPVEVQGTQLHLNVNARYGRVDVRLIDERGEPLCDEPAVVQDTDDVRAVVPLELGFLAKHSGRAIRLEFTLVNAQLFGFQLQ